MKTKLILTSIIVLLCLQSKSYGVISYQVSWLARESATTYAGRRDINGNTVYILETQPNFTLSSFRKATHKFVRVHERRNRNLRLEQDWTRTLQGYACIIRLQSHYRMILVYYPSKGEIHIMGVMDEDPFNDILKEMLPWLN